MAACILELRTTILLVNVMPRLLQPVEGLISITQLD
jgi:hypothetical protein